MSSLNTCEEEQTSLCAITLQPTSETLNYYGVVLREHKCIPLPWTSLYPSLQSLSDSHLVTSLGVCKNESFVIQHATLSSCVKTDYTWKYLIVPQDTCSVSGLESESHLLTQRKCFLPSKSIKTRLTESGIHFYKKHMPYGQTKQLSEKLLQWVSVNRM